MKINISMIKKAFGIVFVSIAFIGCQEMDKPALGNYPKDLNPVGGALKFFVPFDDNTTDPLKFAVDNIRAKFPNDNQFTQTDGITGKGAQGPTDHIQKYIAFSKPNDFAAEAESFTIAFWEKHNGATKGAEYPFSLPSSNGHWSGGTMMLMFDGSEIKFVIVDKNMNDPWFIWNESGLMASLTDNQWHHCAFVYDASTSAFTFYKDGVVVSTKMWTDHGNVNLDDSKVAGLRIGSGPGNTPNDWLSNNWLGSLDQFRMYATALTATEVNQLVTGKL
ncbi:LamG domain-containing protein [Flavobacterium sp. IMCC34518]|uniref:LamG domain-containing protein n=1 Tax=Flavobacterium sp. IMCC34518 TaxID=3003623 RepID=UPI002482830E|nr:LamG domain-containing protein [Flavobacterium sp. IMCC34518]